MQKRKPEWRCLRWMLGFLAATGLAVQVWADDHGDSPAQATALPAEGGSRTGVIDTDIDKDWFSFPALPWIGYTVTVATNILWGSDVELWAANGFVRVAATNSAGRSAPLTITWSNSGAAGKCFIRMGGFAEFTTGSYAVTIARLNWVDGDADGMFDPWELEKLGNTTNDPATDADRDGLTNLQEYYLQSDPRNFFSGLDIIRVASSATGVIVRWQAAEHGTYRLWSATNWLNQEWNPLGDKTKQGAFPAWEEMADPSSTNTRRRLYRVQFLY